MRITPQQIQLQLAEFKLNSKQMPQLKAGDVLNGKIIEIQANALLIALDEGGIIRAEASAVERFSVEENIAFKVASTDGTLVQVEILSDETGDNMEAAKVVKQQLQQVDLPPTPENMKAYEVLKQMDLHITKDNIEKLAGQFKQLNMLFDQVKTTMPEALPKEPQEFAKALADQLGFKDVPEMMKSDLKDVVVRMLNQTDVTVKVPEGSEVSKQPETSKTPEVEVKLPQLMKEVFGLVKETLEEKPALEDTMNKLGQLMKLNKPVNLNNISILDKLSFDNKISDQIKDLMPLLEKEEVSPKLLSLMKGFDIKQFSNEKEVVDFFRALSTQLIEEEDQVSSRVKSAMNQLNESISFLQKEQNEITWIQLPVQMRQETKNLDILIKHDKSGGKQLSKDNAKILIALDTHFIGRVQALISVNQKSLTLDFKVRDNQVKKLLESGIGQLKEAFDSDFNHVKILVKSEEYVSFETFVSQGDQGHIDITV